MGHIINATAFRLGKTQRTSSIWVRKNPQYKSFFLKDLYISRFVKNFFITYNIPLFSPLYIRAKNTGKDDLFPNPWINQGFVFSNCIITRTQTVNIHCFFLDSLLEELRTKFVYSVKANTYLLFKKYQKRNWAHNPYDYFYKNKLWKWRKSKKKRITKRNKLYYLRKKTYYSSKRKARRLQRFLQRLKNKKKYKKQKYYNFNRKYSSFRKLRRYNNNIENTRYNTNRGNASYNNNIENTSRRVYNINLGNTSRWRYNTNLGNTSRWTYNTNRENASRRGYNTNLGNTSKWQYNTNRENTSRLQYYNNRNRGRDFKIKGSSFNRNMRQVTKQEVSQAPFIKKNLWRDNRRPFNPLKTVLPKKKINKTLSRKRSISLKKKPSKKLFAKVYTLLRKKTIFDKKEYFYSRLKYIHKIYFKSLKKKKFKHSIIIKKIKPVTVKKLLYKFIVRTNHLLIPTLKLKPRKNYLNKSFYNNKKFYNKKKQNLHLHYNKIIYKIRNQMKPRTKKYRTIKIKNKDKSKDKIKTKKEAWKIAFYKTQPKIILESKNKRQTKIGDKPISKKKTYTRKNITNKPLSKKKSKIIYKILNKNKLIKKSKTLLTLYKKLKHQYTFRISRIKYKITYKPRQKKHKSLYKKKIKLLTRLKLKLKNITLKDSKLLKKLQARKKKIALYKKLIRKLKQKNVKKPLKNKMGTQNNMIRNLKV